MKCPYCAKNDNRVVDSRVSKDGLAIRRRRECNRCAKRFTTYEKVEEVLPMVVKSDGRREPFDLNKIKKGIFRACEKRPISADQIQDFLDSLEARFQEQGKREIPSTDIGEAVIEQLRQWDGVAYIRFASVYRQFGDVADFMDALSSLMKTREVEDK